MKQRNLLVTFTTVKLYTRSEIPSTVCLESYGRPGPAGSTNGESRTAMSDMIDRRQFLVKTAASMSVPILGFPLAATAGQIRLPFDTVLIDERIVGNEVLARVARASAVQCVSVRGDLTRLWFDSLRGACLQGSTLIAGFTSDLDSEVMRAFARDVGYRQELRVEITFDGRTGAGAASRSTNSAPPSESSLSRGLDELIDHYINAPMHGADQRAPMQLAAWVIAPIRG